ncbi:agmatine deiminase family protein [bacterium]|nr:agmatine deiminase family protein [candidate division CSSED10-310 bacterium]
MTRFDLLLIAAPFVSAWVFLTSITGAPVFNSSLSTPRVLRLNPPGIPTNHAIPALNAPQDASPPINTRAPSIKQSRPKSDNIVFFPEWHPASAVMVSWLDFDLYYTDLVMKLTRKNQVQIIVDSANQKDHVQTLLSLNRVDPAMVTFYTCIIDDVWIVDYSPLYITVSNQPILVDMKYFRTLDDHFPEFLGAVTGLSVQPMPLVLEGGNVMTDGHGNCFTTTEILAQNPDYSESQIRDFVLSYIGCSRLHILKKLSDGTGHIDMYAKLLHEDLMLVGQYEIADKEYEILEYNTRYIENLISCTGRRYTVFRIPMPGSPGDYMTYTNSLIVNDQVFVPVYDLPEDSIALCIYHDAMPGYEIVPVVAVDPIFAGGAIHCTTKIVPQWNASSLPLQESPKASGK